MALESLVEEILKKGEEEVSRIKSEAEEKAKSIISDARRKAEELLLKAREEAEKEIESIRRQEISSVNLEMKRELLNKKKDVLERVFEAVKERIKNMEKEEKREILKKMVERNASGNMAIYSNKEDEEIVREIASELNLIYRGNVDCIGGVILESLDGNVRINLTFDDILKQVYEKKIGEVSRILFGE